MMLCFQYAFNVHCTMIFENHKELLPYKKSNILVEFN